MANNTRTLVNNNFGRRKENTKYFSVFFLAKKKICEHQPFLNQSQQLLTQFFENTKLQYIWRNKR